jgi:5'-3' exonuclease
MLRNAGDKIGKYYPEQFEIDRNGKKAAWEGNSQNISI